MNFDLLKQGPVELLLEDCRKLSEHAMFGVCDFSGFVGLALYRYNDGIPVPLGKHTRDPTSTRWDQTVLAGLTPTAALAALISTSLTGDTLEPLPTGAIVKFGAENKEDPEPLGLVIVGPSRIQLAFMGKLSLGTIWLRFQEGLVVEPGAPLHSSLVTYPLPDS